MEGSWVMEWTSVLVIILRIPKKKSQAKYSGATKDHRQSKLFHCINRSENKLTIRL